MMIEFIKRIGFTFEFINSSGFSIYKYKNFKLAFKDDSLKFLMKGDINNFKVIRL